MSKSGINLEQEVFDILNEYRLSMKPKPGQKKVSWPEALLAWKEAHQKACKS